MDSTTEAATNTEKKVVNFMDFDYWNSPGYKQHDWRYEQYSKIAYGKDKPREVTAYWIGVVDLSESWEKIMFYNSGRRELQVDTYMSRHDDGAATGNSFPVRYKFPDNIRTLMDAAYKEGKRYYNIFIEETVERDGSHIVYMLYGDKTPESGEQIIYGVASDKPWPELPTKNWIEYSQFTFHAMVKKIHIGGSNSYRWMK